METNSIIFPLFKLEKIKTDFMLQEPINGNQIRSNLEVVLQTIHEVTTDVGQVKDALKVTMRQKQRLENETLSLLHNFQVMY